MVAVPATEREVRQLLLQNTDDFMVIARCHN
jgi:hypothetical protein